MLQEASLFPGLGIAGDFLAAVDNVVYWRKFRLQVTHEQKDHPLRVGNYGYPAGAGHFLAVQSSHHLCFHFIDARGGRATAFYAVNRKTLDLAYSLDGWLYCRFSWFKLGGTVSSG